MSHRSEQNPAPTRMFLPVAAIGTVLFVLTFVLCARGQQAQKTPTPAASVDLPNLVRFKGQAVDSNGKPITGPVGITFALYERETGGPSLWLETQTVQVDATGHYTALLGITKPEGMPAEVFVSGQARWIGAQVSGEKEQPRVMLLAVPYAIKAGDAATLGGLPPSAFMAALPAAASGDAGSRDAASVVVTASSSPVTTSGGTANAIPMFTTATNLQNSILTQTGAAAINVAGKLVLPAIGVATAATGRYSRPEDFVASAFSSTSNSAVQQVFQLQAESVGNNTSAPSGRLSLLFGTGTSAPTETGLKISNKGILTFAAGQTFPGTGKGTITDVIAGTGLAGGGTSGAVTLNVDATKVPQLQSANTFTGAEKFTGNVGVGTAPTTNGYVPLAVSAATNFGTWLALSNTSPGGHTWNIISAGSGNAEGAGNLGITDLKGTSTIWLEGNTRTSTLTATGGVSAATLTATSSSGSAIIDADVFGQNANGVTPGLRFGGSSSGEGIASNRVIGINKYGLDFYTNYTKRISVLNSGQVGIGVTNVSAQLGVVALSNAYPAIYTQGDYAPSGSGQTGGDGIDSFGNNGDGAANGGAGGVFNGGGGGSSGWNGEGVVAFGGSYFASFPETYAGDFQGAVFAKGGVWTPSNSTIMDHPLDPANKFLVHSSVQSSEMMNVYSGNVVTDAAGEAVVNLPEWMEALNRDFRYQLTTIGQPAQAWIASKIANHAFTIKTDRPNVEISWQITGIRQDAWANAHQLPVEQPKSAREAGHYLNPELFGAPEESSILWARHPEMMKKLKQMRLHHSGEGQAAETAR